MGRAGRYCIKVAPLGDIQQAVVLRRAGKVQASDEANDSSEAIEDVEMLYFSARVDASHVPSPMLG